MSFRVIAGDSKTVKEQLFLNGNKYVPPVGSTLIFTIKKFYTDADADAVCQKITGAGLTVVDSVAHISLVRNDTYNALPGPYYYDVQSQQLDGNIYDVATGTATILPDITRGTDTSVTVYTTSPSATQNAVAAAAAALQSANEAAASASSIAGDTIAAAASALAAYNSAVAAHNSELAAAASAALALTADGAAITANLNAEIARAQLAEAAAITTANNYTDTHVGLEAAARLLAHPLKSNNLSDLASIPTAKQNLGIDQVNNTSDANKPISSATGAALSGKQPLATVLTNTTASFTPALQSQIENATTTLGSNTFVQRNGLSGGQTVSGGTGANEDLTLHGTTSGTKTTSYVNIQPDGGKVGIGTTTPSRTLSVAGDISATGNLESSKVVITRTTGNVLEVINGSGDTTLTVTSDGLISGHSARYTWIGLVTGAVPTGPTVITGGQVYTYNYGTTVRYRFINTAGTLDAFYSNFNGINVTGLLVSKGLTF
jgi:hypothetical protein